LLAAIILFAAALRLTGLAFDLPYVYHPDEPFNVAIVQSIFRGDLNPHFFVYPSLFYYVQALAYVPYYLVGSLAGAFHARSDIMPLVEIIMGVTRAPDPGLMVLSRVVSASFSTAAVALAYIAGRRLFDRAGIGLAAAALLAVMPAGVVHARYVTPDAFVLFFVTASLVASVLVYRQGRPRDYVLAGVLVGLTASTKYNAALVVVSVAAAHFLRAGNQGLRERWLYVAALCACAAFVAATPYAVLDARTFVDFLRVDAHHYATGHPGMEGQPLRWYVTYMATTAPVLSVLAVLEIARGIATRDRAALLLSIFPIVYFAFITSFEVRNDRTFLPLTPYVCLLGASLLAHAWQRMSHWHTRARRTVAYAAVPLVALVAFAEPAASSISGTVKLLHPDGRAVARAWIAAHVPAGSRIALESYAPYVEPGRFVTLPVPQIIDHDPQWYVENGAQYLVMSEGMYGRYFADPARYARQVEQYERFFATFPLVKIFDEGHYEIRIYEVPKEPALQPARP
jgi:4-amino-4-deoxy-L-arabinose transferase-like glycosyltransferase